MYGVLSPDLDTQAVRVYPLEAFPTLGSSAPLEANVFSVDTETGERRVWQDSVVVDSTGQYGHVFWAPFRAEFGHTYRIEVVRRADGATSFAEVRVPPPVTVRINERDAPFLEVVVEGESIRASRPVAEYVIGTGPPLRQYEVLYEGTMVESAGGWSTTFNMLDDYNLIRFHPPSGGGYCYDFVPLFAMYLHVLVGDAVWDPPGGVFGPELAYPTTMSNVENGYGFVGGGFALVERLPLSREAVELACFTYVDEENG